MGLSDFLSNGKLGNFLAGDNSVLSIKSPNKEIDSSPNKIWNAVGFILQVELVSRINYLYIAGKHIGYIVKCQKVLFFLSLTVPRLPIFLAGNVLFNELYKKIWDDKPGYFNRITLKNIKVFGFEITCAYFIAWCAKYFDNQITISEPLYTSPHGNVDIIGVYSLLIKTFVANIALPKHYWKLFDNFYKNENENHQKEIYARLEKKKKEKFLELTNEIDENTLKLLELKKEKADNEASWVTGNEIDQIPQVEEDKGTPVLESFYNFFDDPSSSMTRFNKTDRISFPKPTTLHITVEQEQKLHDLAKHNADLAEHNTELDKEIYKLETSIGTAIAETEEIKRPISDSIIKNVQIQQVENMLTGDLIPTIEKALHVSPFWRNETTQEYFKFLKEIDESKKDDVMKEVSNYVKTQEDLSRYDGTDLNLLIKKYTTVLPSNVTGEEMLFNTAVFIYSQTKNINIFSEENLKELSGQIFKNMILQEVIPIKAKSDKQIPKDYPTWQRVLSQFRWISNVENEKFINHFKKEMFNFKDDNGLLENSQKEAIQNLYEKTEFFRKVKKEFSPRFLESILGENDPTSLFQDWFDKQITTKIDFLFFINSVLKEHKLSETEQAYITALRNSPNPVLYIETRNTFLTKKTVSVSLKTLNMVVAMFQQKKIMDENPDKWSFAISTVSNLYTGYKQHSEIDRQNAQNFGPTIQNTHYRPAIPGQSLSTTPGIDNLDKLKYFVTDVYAPAANTYAIIETLNKIGPDIIQGNVTKAGWNALGLGGQLLIPGLIGLVIYRESHKNNAIMMKVVFGLAFTLAIDMYLTEFVNPNHTFTLNVLDPNFYKWETEQNLIFKFHENPFFYNLTNQAFSIVSQRYMFKQLHNHFFPERQIPYIRNVSENETNTIRNSVLSFVHVLWYKYPRLRYLFMNSNEQDYNLMIDLLCLSPAECPIPQWDNVPNLWNTLSPDGINLLIQIIGMGVVANIPDIYTMAPLISIISLFFCKLLPGPPAVRLIYEPLTRFTQLKLPDCLLSTAARAHIKIITIDTKYNKKYQHSKNFEEDEEISLVIVDCTKTITHHAMTKTIPREFTVNDCVYKLVSFIESKEEKNIPVTNMTYDDVNWVTFEDGKQHLKLEQVWETNQRVQLMMYENVTRELKVNLPFTEVVETFITRLQIHAGAVLIIEHNKFQPHNNDHIRCEIYACVLAYLTLKQTVQTDEDVTSMAEMLKKEYTHKTTLQSSNFQNNDFKFLNEMFSNMDADFVNNQSYSNNERSMLLRDPYNDFKAKAEFITSRLTCSLTIYLCDDIYSENELVFQDLTFGKLGNVHLQVGCLYGAVSHHPKPIYHFFPLKKEN
jgi:hypothetical protein